MADVLVTGASGVLGRPLVAALLGEGHTVRATSRRPRADGTIRWHRADVATGDGVAEAVRGVDAIVHCATHPFRTRAVDLEGLRRLRAAAPEARIVYPSIVGVDAVRFPYYRVKLACEAALEGTPHAIVRLTQFHEFPHQLATLPVPLVPAGFRTQPIAAAEAAAQVARLVEGPGGRRPDAGGPEVHDLRTLVARVARARGRKAPVLAVPMPGSAGFREGWNLCPERRVGRQRWDEHFEAWQAAGCPALAREELEEGGRLGALRSP